jgi:NAD(P)-dependent dehydrogenase (short-subunit alcohol dehydrogenase family)
MDKLLEHESALVTGGAGGIGLAIATEILRHGARVVIADNNGEAGAAAAHALARQGDVRFANCDLRSRDEVDRLVRHTLATFGRLSILVHAASPPRQEEHTIFGVDDATFDAMLAVNVTAALRLAQQIGRHMIDQNIRGRMLFVTSLHAERPRNLPHYSAAKAGLTMIVKECARAFGAHGIRVNALVPGAIVTGGVVTDPGMAEKIALRRTGTPDDIAPMAVVLLSDRFSRYVTGASIVVDGGLDLYDWFAPRQ